MCDEYFKTRPFEVYSLVQLNGLLDRAERHQETVLIRDLKEEISYRNSLLDQDDTMGIDNV